MALNLTDISGSDTIRGFVETHNKNNTTIEEYISKIETTISDLKKEIEDINETHSTRLNEISNKLTITTEELKDTINSYESEKYGALLSKLEESNECIKVLGETLKTILNKKLKLTNIQMTTLYKKVEKALNNLYTEQNQ